MNRNTDSPDKPRWLGRLLVVLGLTGATVAALCCIAPFLVAGMLAAIGLGFLLHDAVLMGLLVVSLLVAGLGYQVLRRKRNH